MLSFLKSHFSLIAVEAEAKADERIYERALEVFIKRETMNSYLSQFVFVLVAIAGYSLRIRSVFVIGILHVLVDQLVRHNLVRFSQSLRHGDPDARLLRHIEHVFYGVGFVWAMVAWPLAESLDGLRLVLTVVSAAGLLVMANSTCYAPKVFQATVIGYALGMALAISVMTTIPWYVFGGAIAAFLVVVTAVGAGTARQLLQMLHMQVERDKAIEEQQRTIAALDLARRAATQMAETDSLTGLANRFLFLKKLDGLIAAGERISLTLLDVDLFKNVNDALGHDTGDEVLKVIGRVLAAFEEGLCFAARLGGDEFALVADCGRNQRNGDEIISATKKQIDCARTANLDLPTISITGGSAYFPQDASNGSDLLAAADIAQREAKKARRGGHLDYSASLSNMFRRETQIAHALSQAIASRELFLCFQPKINLRTGRVAGAEALSRFSAAGLAGYSLEEIFEVAENRGLGTFLDELVLDRYREALVALRDEHSIALPTSVNLSGAILKTHDRLLAKLNQLIADGLSPALIRVEITENAIYGRGQDAVIELVNRIVKLGFSLALDDFGTGSGALQHLASLPVSEIKIDRSFVSGMDSDRRKGAIVRGLIVTGRAMGIDIVAEGVETEGEATLLRLMGAQFAQGFLWSKPIPMAQFVAFVRLFGPSAMQDMSRRAENDSTTHSKAPLEAPPDGRQRQASIRSSASCR
jgi:diguanylate cyclase (GGDEF)-like protein